MFKRLISFHLAICLLFLGLLGKIAFISTDNVYTASAGRNSVALTIEERRGMFYDRNMNALVNEQKEYVAIVRPTEKVITSLDQMFTKKEIDSIMIRLKAGKPILQKVSSTTKATEHIPIITISSRYSGPQLLAHLIGNAAAAEENRFGLEKAFYSFLTTDGSIKIKYYVDARGRMLQGDTGEIITKNYDSQKGVRLTIDKQIQKICEKAADDSESFIKGAIVVLDVNTSKILAMVSRPNIDLNRLSDNIDDSNSPFINRALTAYTVGSVFKLAVAATAIENGLESFVHNCTGSIRIGDTVFNCHQLEGHGQMNLQSAIAQSCNPYFVDLGQHIGGTVLLNQIQDFGFGEETELAQGLKSMPGILPSIKAVNESGNLANFSFGQGDLLATPLQIANMIACIANNGNYNTPTLVDALIDDDGNVIETISRTVNSKSIMQSATANMIQRYMIDTVETGSGRRATPAQGGAGGKTATAETGWMKENGQEVLHVWFAGFYPAQQPRYAIVVMDEDGKSGATDCGPIFKQIADEIASQNLT